MAALNSLEDHSSGVGTSLKGFDQTGLSQAEAEKRLQEVGPNAIPVDKPRPWLTLLRKMWAPVPWMLEASLLLELLLGKYVEAGVIAFLVIFNAIMSTLQENNAQNALALLRSRLTIAVRVLRDGRWQTIPSTELVPDDVLYLRMGDLVPADVKLVAGQVSLDQSTLTGESLPVERETGGEAYAGTVVKRGEATGLVSATGVHTKFGRTAELVKLARTTGQLERIVFSIVRSLVYMDCTLAALVLGYAVLSGLSLAEVLPFALILLVASIPVALPATFTVATALGAFELTRKGVLVTRLNALEEAAGMEVLCADKTGTLTENQLEVAAIRAVPPFSKEDTLRLAAMASDEATQDPLDIAILKKARQYHMYKSLTRSRQQFVPFEPATKRSEAFYLEDGRMLRVMKGAPQVIGSLANESNGVFAKEVQEMEKQGYRVLVVAAGEKEEVRMAGLVAFQDPPRPDSRSLVARLKQLGIHVVMITGDGLETARAIAARIGIGERVRDLEDLEKNDPDGNHDYDVYAEVLPEDKFSLVKKYQRAGVTVGMTGDGVNDAPALEQADVGIAVSNASDVAKAAASLVLTSSGLGNLVAAIETSRQIYQRMLTYTLNKIIKTIEIAFFLSLGLILAHTFVTTPLLIVLWLFANDFVTMSIATDWVTASGQPNQWNVRTIVIGAACIALPLLALSFGFLGYFQNAWSLSLAQLQTALFVMLVYSGQGTIYLIRERRHFWKSIPSRWMLLGTLLDVIVIALLASQGILMASIPLRLVAVILTIITVFLVLLDFVKVPVFERLQLR